MNKFDFTISDASEDVVEQVSLLLKNLDLVYEDFRMHIENFIVAVRDELVIGCVGYENYGRLGLLRSVAVDPKYQGMGIGHVLIQNILEKARKAGIKNLYLLTDSAVDFFKKFDFVVISRELVDEKIKQTYEYSEACPDTGYVMIRKL